MAYDRGRKPFRSKRNDRDAAPGRARKSARRRPENDNAGGGAKYSGPPAKRGARARPSGDQLGPVRLQKVMALAGVGSRRHCEEMIDAGRVQVDGVVAKIGTRVDPKTQQIRVDGEVLRTRRDPIYFLVNKPDGVVSTNYDPAGRPRVIDLVPSDDREHLFTVGRLDMTSEGLILVTNDGELANLLTHPRYGVEKTYSALVAGQPEPGVYQKLLQGVHLAEGVARCARVYVKKALPQSTSLEIVLNEGKNREIRRILAKVGHKVLKLRRTAIAGVKLGALKPGEFRIPTAGELRDLREAVYRKRKPRPARPVNEADAKAAAVEQTSDAPEEPKFPVDSRRTERLKFQSKRRPTPMFPERKKRPKPPKPGFGTIIGDG